MLDYILYKILDIDRLPSAVLMLFEWFSREETATALRKWHKYITLLLYE